MLKDAPLNMEREAITPSPNAICRVSMEHNMRNIMVFMNAFRPVFASDTAIAQTEIPADESQSSDASLDAAQEFLAETTPGMGHNQPPAEIEPVETSYVPLAKSEDELVNEAKEVADTLTGVDNTLRTNTTSKLTRLCADIVALGSPELRANFHDITAIGESFKDRKQLRAAIRLTVKRYLGDEAFALPVTQSILSGAVNMACLLAYGYAKMAYFPLRVRRSDGSLAGLNRHAIGKVELSENDNPAEYGQGIAVPYNVYAPTIWRRVPKAGGNGEMVAVSGTATRNLDNETLYFLTNEVAGYLYAFYIDHEPSANFIWDDDAQGKTGAGFILGKKRTTGGTQSAGNGGESQGEQTNGNGGSNGESQSETGTNGNAVEMATGNARYAMIQLIDDLPALEVGETIGAGIVQGLYKWAADKPNGQIQPDWLRQFGGLANAMCERMLEMWEEGKPTYGMLKQWALLGETLSEHVKFDDTGEVVMYRPLGSSSEKDWQRIAPPRQPDEEQDTVAELEAAVE